MIIYIMIDCFHDKKWIMSEQNRHTQTQRLKEATIKTPSTQISLFSTLYVCFLYLHCEDP